MRRFKRNILIFSVVFVPITFSLGLWQLERAKEKNEIIAEFEKLQQMPSVDLLDVLQIKNWQPVYANGQYEDFILYEDNAILEGRAGYRIYHLFRIEDKRYIFVNRGFLERKQKKNDLPFVNTPKTPFKINGYILQKANNEFVSNVEEKNPLVIQQLNFTELSMRYPELRDKEVLPYLFNLLPSDINKFKSIEKPTNMSSATHIGYAIQWFGLCLALLIMTFLVLRKNER
jgi:cytochrome oxidase assembly protein ShyY1